MMYGWILQRYFIDVACEKWSDAGWESGYETRALKLICDMSCD
jgi:hypothetical protein